MAPVPGDPKNILWIRVDELGDFLWSSGALPHVRRRFPDARITVLCPPYTQELYEGNKDINAIIPCEKGRIYGDPVYLDALGQYLSQQGYDLVLNSIGERTLALDLLVKKIGAPQAIANEGGFNNIAPPIKAQTDLFYTKLAPKNPAAFHESEKLRDFVEAVGVPLGRFEAGALRTTPDDEAQVDRLLAENGLAAERTVVLAMGAGDPAPLRWYAWYGKAIGAICRERGLKVAIVGRACDKAVIEQNRPALADIAVDLTNKTTLRQLVALIKRCRIVVGAETGTTNIASVLGVPNVFVMGGGSFGWFLPYAANDAVACLPLDCYHCWWKCHYGFPHCVRDLAPEVLADAFRRTLDGLGPQPRIFMQAADRFADRHVIGDLAPAWKKPGRFAAHLDPEFVTVTPPLVRWNARQEWHWLAQLPDAARQARELFDRLGQEGHHDKALRFLESACGQQPGVPQMAYLYARALQARNRSEEASAFLRLRDRNAAGTIPLSYLLVELLAADLERKGEARDEALMILAVAPADRLAKANAEVLS